jgi:transcriptional regulator with XRE-family HTH domain
MNSFGDWLQNEMTHRGLGQHDLARLSGISQGSVGNVIRGDRSPGPDLCHAIARAFKMPPEIVFRAAGLLPPVSEKTERVERILHLLETMPEAELDGLEIQIAALASRHTKIKPKTGPLRGQP